MPGARIAIATCAAYPDLKVDDDLLREALGEHGAEGASVVWDEEGVDWGCFDLCLVRSTWDYHEKHGAFLDWARRVEAATALRNPADVIAWNSDKTYLRQLDKRGVRTVPTAWVERGSETDLEAVLAERGWDAAVVKPVVDLGAKNLHRVRRGEGSGALEEVLRQHDAMVQPFLPSLEERGETSLVYVDGAFSHAVRKRPAPGDFRVQSIWGGTVAPAEPEPDQVELAEQALSQLDEAPLYARVDLVTGLDGEPCLIELELIEPNLYLSTHPSAAGTLAEAALLRIDVNADRDVA
jgi:glutathione synthase/RimK-type ligase-like ATP-grasp enzyme